jgi:phospholipase/lecithinase/hemolysin
LKTSSSPNTDSALWNPHNTLFAFWIGINDVGNSFWLDINRLYDQIFAVYRDLLEQVIALGAKNILLLNVPPFDRAPLQIGQGPDSQAIAAAGIANFNARIVRLASSIERAHRGTVVFEFNTHELYTNALNDPTAYPETALYKNLTAFCNDYQK